MVGLLKTEIYLNSNSYILPSESSDWPPLYYLLGMILRTPESVTISYKEFSRKELKEVSCWDTSPFSLKN